MSDLLSPETRERRRSMLRSAMGPAIALALEEPDVVEVLVNPDGRLWLDRHGSGRADTGVVLTPHEAERIIRLSNFMHVFIVQVDQIAKRANVPRHTWLGRSVAVDITLHLERPFFAVLTPSECLGHIAGLAADLDAPVSRCHLCEGRHACALRLSCALCVHREVKTGTNVCNFV
jgi:hypothetical protein